MSRARFRLRGLALGALCAVVLAAGPARAEGEGTNFMEDPLGRILMVQAERARLTACKAVSIPAGTNMYRIEYHVTRTVQPQVPRPANAMTAIVATESPCPR